MWTFCPECHSRRDAMVSYCEACGAPMPAAAPVAIPQRLKKHSAAAVLGLVVALMHAALRHVI